MFAAGTLLFCLSLTSRTIDARLREVLPAGTPFVWRILNEIILFVLSSALVQEAAAGT